MTAIGFVLIVAAVFAANSPLALLDQHGNVFFIVQVVVVIAFVIGLVLFTGGIAKLLWDTMP